jgi:hypothetical protein
MNISVYVKRAIFALARSNKIVPNHDPNTLLDEAIGCYFELRPGCGVVEEKELDSLRDTVNAIIEAITYSQIVNPDEAYVLGYTTMSTIAAKILVELSPEDFADDIKTAVNSKCWQEFEDILGVSIPVPNIHMIVKEHYDKGIHDSLKNIIIPPYCAPQTMGKNLMRLEKLLINI